MTIASPRSTVIAAGINMMSELPAYGDQAGEIAHHAKTRRSGTGNDRHETRRAHNTATPQTVEATTRAIHPGTVSA